MTAAKPRESEADIQRACVQLLEADDWRALRMEHAIERNAKGGFKRRVGEVGMPDYLFIRYSKTGLSINMSRGTVTPMANAEVLWIEFKRKGEKPENDQLDWHKVERNHGALVLVVDDIDEFTLWYKASGLCRRVR